MKKLFVIICNLLLFKLYMTSQNLVTNPSFEIISTCPTYLSQIYYAPPWFQPLNYNGNTNNNSTSDLFNWCYTLPLGAAGVPTNQFGYQFARSGNGYAGIICFYDDTTNYREYIEVPLTSTLIANRKYCIEFYASLASGSGNAISNMGVYFSNDSLLNGSGVAYAFSSITPQVENPTSNMLNDTTSWMLVSGNFIASGGEKYMTIGNFHNPATTNSQPAFGTFFTFAYYYIDDVSVVDCTGDGVNEITDGNGINIYPNPATDAITIELKTKTKQGGMIEIKDVLGQVVYSSKINTTKTVIDLGGFAKGVYFVEVGNERKKIVKE